MFCCKNLNINQALWVKLLYWDYFFGGFVDDSAFFCNTILPNPCIIREDYEHLSD